MRPWLGRNCLRSRGGGERGAGGSNGMPWWLLAALVWRDLTGVAVMLEGGSLLVAQAASSASRESWVPTASTDMTQAGVDEVMTTSRMSLLLCAAAREAAAAA
jgi:hypothetical protein